MDIAFLSAPVPLTKTYKQLRGRIEKSNYPNTSSFTSYTETPKRLEDFYAAIVEHAKQGHCLLKGQLNRNLVEESRAGSTESNQATEWVCLDIDGLEVESPQAFMDAIGLGSVSYIVQYSSSYGVLDDLLRCHIFCLLDKPVAAPLLKQWLIDVNFNTELLCSQMSLTPSGNGLHWPLDITTCQNDKLLYIAPPNLIGVPDPLQPDERYQLVKNKGTHFKLPKQIGTVSANRSRIDDKVNELRLEAGMPKRKASKYNSIGPVEFVANPDQCTVTGIKEDRGFVYLNLNGGDSWGYYHPVDKPDFIYNFKGEPTYKTKDLVPDYWHDQQRKVEEAEESGEVVTHLAFRDFNSAKYYNGWYDPDTRELVLKQAASEKQLADYMASQGRALSDRIPIWSMEFLPSEDWTLNREYDPPVINTFVQSPYLQAKRPSKAPSVPTLIARIIHHALGGDEEVTDRFYNWLAAVMQKRVAIGTSWVLSGTQGTGKGLICNKILRPILGDTYVQQKRMDELDEKFNDFMEQCIFLFVDEVQLSEMRNGRALMQRIKNQITEERISIRGMHRAGQMMVNHVNWVFCTNMPDPIYLTSDDRRFNIAPFQPNKLLITSEEIEAIEDELQQFCDYLMMREVDFDLARAVIMTEQRERLINTSSTSIELACDAVRRGDLQFFLDELPSDSQSFVLPDTMLKLSQYKRALREVIEHASTGGKGVGRDVLHTLLRYVLPDCPTSSHKFTSLIKHHGLYVQSMRIGTRTTRGIEVDWVVPEGALDQIDGVADKPVNDEISPKTKAELKKHLKGVAGGKSK